MLGISRQRQWIQTVFLSCCVLFVAPPEVLVSKQSRKLSASANVTLTCRASGSPQPMITWSRRDTQLPRSDRSIQTNIYTEEISLVAFIASYCVLGIGKGI